MKINEIITEKEQLNEFPPAAVAAWPLLKTAAAWGLKKIAPKLGWMAKKSYDSSVPDALKTSKVGYGTGQVDPSLATAARQKLAVAGKGVKPKPPARGEMSPEAGAAIAQAQQAQGKRRRP